MKNSTNYTLQRIEDNNPPILHTDYVYLISPYSHDLEEIRNKRYRDNVGMSALLIDEYRCKVFSPITHSHPIALLQELVGPQAEMPHDFWMSIDMPIVEHVATCGVLMMLNGWAERKDVEMEVRKLIELNKPIFGVSPATGQFYFVDIAS